MAKIVISTQTNPEDNAMLQALYSRSAESVTTHLEKLEKVGSGKFMSQYYLGYGHDSIADCGFITIYVEGVSMLVAKAIEDNPLYNGQECSSRYIDWSSQEFFVPEGTSQEGIDLMNFYRQFYVTQKPLLIEHLKTKYAIKEGESETFYEKAITARAFDILRGFLPCGATTNVSWTTSLRKANDHLAWMALHPLKEVRDIAGQIHYMLLEKYPSSIKVTLPDFEDPANSYLRHQSHYYSNGDTSAVDAMGIDISYLHGNLPALQTELIHSNMLEFMNTRPRKTQLPKAYTPINETYCYGWVYLDYGSYRDLHRHRGGHSPMPPVNLNRGVNDWYLDSLPEYIRTVAKSLIYSAQEFCLSSKDLSVIKAQYFAPMGTQCLVHFNYTLPHALYIAELRSGQTVHPTLRPIAQAMGRAIETLGFNTYCDYSEDEWNIRRGKQDIVEVNSINPSK